jgi:serralysin
MYQVWNTDSDGDFTSSANSVMQGADAALQAFESFFQQDLNRDNMIL